MEVELKVELLYFDGCPHYEAVLLALREELGRAGLEAQLVLVRVETAEQAETERFLGSPTVRVDGADVEPAAAGREDFGLKCRVYQLAGRTSGIPPRELIAAAIRAAG
ncbi:MAG: hypothetical protein U0R71_00725 [Solirubrobacterales bacterium]